MSRVVVVGGGIIGLCAAYSLRQRGWDVTVLDAGKPGGAASSGNAGWIVPALSGPVPVRGLVKTSLTWMLRGDSPLYIKPRLDPALVRWLALFWRRCNARDYAAGLAATMELNRRTMPLFDELRANGVDFEMHADGLLMVYRSVAEMEHDRSGLELLSPFGLVPEVLDGDRVRDEEPALVDDVVGGFLFADERHVRPDDLAAGLVAHLSARGVDIRSGTAVQGFERSGQRLTLVRTADGPVTADVVLISAGAWTPAVARLAGVRVPIEAGKGYSLDYVPPPFPVRRPLYLHGTRVAVTPLDGLVRLAGTMELSGVNERLVPTRVAAIARAGARYLRGWPATPGTARAWTGMRPLTPDGLPVIGFAPGFRNLAVASGHAMLGVTLGPATGEAVAELLTTGNVPPVLEPFDLARF